MKEYKYLAYILQAHHHHVREKVKRKTAVMGKVWSIRKRKFGKEWGKRMWMFDKLVWTVI